MATTEAVKAEAIATFSTYHRLLSLYPGNSSALITLQQDDGSIVFNWFLKLASQF